MHCPRCGADNSGNRASCWRCFAQLEAGTGTPLYVAPREEDPAVEPTAAEQSLWVAAAQNAESPQTGTVGPEGDSPSPFAMPQETQPDQSKYVVPGLAEQPQQASEDSENDNSPWKNNPVPAGQAASAAAREERASKGRGNAERPRNSSSSASGGQKSPVVPIIAGVVVIGLIAAWWFLLFNPSPVPAAKAYVAAKMNEASTALAGSPMAGSIKMEAGDVKDAKITGDTAEVSMDTKTGVMGMNVSATLRVALNKQGSFFKKEWQVDEERTKQLQAEDAGKMLGGMMGGMMKGGMPKGMGGMKGMPGAPTGQPGAMPNMGGFGGMKGMKGMKGPG